MTVTAGVVLQGVDPPDVFESMVQEIENLGYSYLWMTDSSLHARNVYAYLTLAAHSSSELTLGTAVTNPVTRHPGITAAAIATVDEICSGRAVLGIGAGDRPLLALGLRPARLATLRAAVETIRSLLASQHVDHSGEGLEFVRAHLRFPARAEIPIFISATGPRTLELAGEIADGVILLVGLFPESIDYAIECVDVGAARAGRPRPHVAVFAYGAIDEDEERAIDAARSIAAWYPQTAPHICRLAGLDEEVIRSVRDSYQGGEFQEAATAAKLLPTEFIQQVALSGSPERSRIQLKRVAEAGADSIHVFPLGQDRIGTIRAFASCRGLYAPHPD